MWLVPSGNNLNIGSGNSLIAAFSLGQDRLRVYKDANGQEPFFFINSANTAGWTGGGSLQTNQVTTANICLLTHAS